MLQRKPRSNREGSHSGSSCFAAVTSSSIDNRHLNQTQQIDQFIHRIGNQTYNNNGMVETSSDQLPQQGYENMTRVPCRFYRQMTYDEKLQAYTFTDTNASILAEISMYIIYHEPTIRNFRYNPEIKQFIQVREEECDWTNQIPVLSRCNLPSSDRPNLLC